MKTLPTVWRWILGSLLAGAVGVAGCVILAPPPLEREWRRIEGPEGNPIALMTWRLPRAGGGEADAEAPRPAAVLCHGISCSKELMTTLAHDLAREGFAVVAHDFAGHGESPARPLTEDANAADTLAVIEWVRARPDVDPDRVVLAGHSMGAVAAALAGRMDARLRAVVCLGQKGPCDPRRPANLLQLYGLYDQYHTVGAMSRALGECARSPEDARPVFSPLRPDPARFGEPGRRALVVSPDGDHASEVYSPRMIRQAREWLCLAVGAPLSHRAASSAWRVYFEFLAGLGFFAAGVIFLASAPLPGPPRCWAAAPAALTLLAAAWVRGPAAPPVSLALTLFYLISSAGFYCRGGGENSGGGARALRWLAGAGLAAAAFALGSLLASADQWARHPRLIAWAPAAALNIAVHRAHFVFNILRADFFGSYSEALRPGALFAALALLEPALPGTPWRAVGWFGGLLRRRVVEFRLAFALGARDRKTLLALAILLPPLALILWVRWRDGLLGADSILPTLLVMLRMYGLPFLVLLALLRRIPFPSAPSSARAPRES